jgi:dUTP pyrophosphatase
MAPVYRPLRTAGAIDPPETEELAASSSTPQRMAAAMLLWDRAEIAPDDVPLGVLGRLALSSTEDCYVQVPAMGAAKQLVLARRRARVVFDTLAASPDSEDRFVVAKGLLDVAGIDPDAVPHDLASKLANDPDGLVAEKRRELLDVIGERPHDYRAPPVATRAYSPVLDRRPERTMEPSRSTGQIKVSVVSRPGFHEARSTRVSVNPRMARWGALSCCRVGPHIGASGRTTAQDEHLKANGVRLPKTMCPSTHRIVAVHRLRPDAHLPVRAYDGDAALDLHCVEGFALEPGKYATVPTGIAIALDPSLAGLVLPRSGLASTHGVTVLNAPGLIDPNYRGEVRVSLINLGPAPFAAEAGERIAQLLLTPIVAVDLVEQATLSIASARGTKGFGSSGR